MMQVPQLAAILESAVCLAAVTILLLTLWPALRLDSFRQNMFGIRDEMFDYAASGKIGFDHPAYRLLRQLMNSFIRYGHQLTLFRVAMNVAIWRLSGQQPKIAWVAKLEKALQGIEDEEVKRTMEGFHSRAMELVAKRLVFGSPILLLALLCSVGAMVLHKGWHNVKQALIKSTTVAVARVVDLRLLEEEAVGLNAA
ncbi:MAG: hypothetical protein ACLQOO_01030 [Terriglobia bacterium]